MRRFVFAWLLLLGTGCGLVLDNSPPDPNVGSGDGGGSRIPCRHDSQCDDGNPCNGAEVCAADHYCVAGTPIMCPGHGCIVGVCKPADGTCIEVPSDAACSDGIDCTDDVCNPDATCSHTANAGHCDDGIDCTYDVCLAAAQGSVDAGCHSLPKDSLCSQPAVTNACAAYVCAPAATKATSGCAIAPHLGFCGAGARCNLDTFQCEALPSGCTGCQDGNPCNGVESCDPLASVPVCTTTGGCPASANTCTVAVCNTTGNVPMCSTAPSNDVACVTPIVLP